MSSRAVSPRVVEELRAELAELRLQCASLQSRIEAVEDRLGGASEFEVVSHPSSSAAAAAGADLPEARVQAAERVGAWLRRCLNDQPRGLSGRETVDLASRVYIVARDSSGTRFDPPKILSTWASTKPLVLVGGQPVADSIFVGLPSKSEARIALLAAGLQLPAELTRHR